MSCASFIDVATQYFSADPQRLYGPIAKALVTKVPYISVLKSGTFPASVSATLLSVAQGRPFMATSMANPVFANMLNLCGSCSLNVDANGSNQYSYVAQINQGTSDKICLNQGFSSFMGSLTAQLDAYQKGVVQLINSDTRWQIYSRCGIKAVVKAGQAPLSDLTGGEYQIDTPVPATQSTARLTFARLQAYNRYGRSTLGLEPFGEGQGAHSRLIASPDCLENLRTDLGAGAQTLSATLNPAYGNATLLGSLAAGGDKTAVDAIKSYMFEPLYRGIQFAEDPKPLRLNWNGAGYDPVNPDIAYSSTVGTVATVNPAWLAASHEVAFLFFDGSFERQVPAPWTGEGKARFARQMFGGEIQFMNHPDMTSNLFSDYGVMAYRIGRALRPLYPWAVFAIIYKRCQDASDTVTCTGVSG